MKFHIKTTSKVSILLISQTSENPRKLSINIKVKHPELVLVIYKGHATECSIRHLQGEAGAPGGPGDQGFIGDQGPDGNPGNPGEKGSSGVNGIHGDQGPKVRKDFHSIIYILYII